MDEKLPEDATSKVRRILRDPDSESFLTISALAFSNRNDPETMWKYYMEPAIFYKHWPAIKKYILSHNWETGNIPVWQKAYEEMSEERPAQKKRRYAEIGNRLAALRRKAGMSQQEFAGKLDTTQQLISRIEKGDENITLATLFRIARVLKIDVKIGLGKNFSATSSFRKSS